jgi:23S rRNA (cytosine1962-C5)-methyltransferase
MRITYDLLDAGDGGRLERFGERVVDRPAPGAIDIRLDPAAWATADLRFDDGAWEANDEGSTEPWPIEVAGLRLELRPTAAGQVGLFPEHVSLLPWLRDRVAESAGSGGDGGGGADDGPAATVLNLFGSTGATTLALAQAGAAVTHVDASRPAVAWARHNAELSGLADAPVRWIVDDALAFVRREVRRGRGYRGIVLDPPSYGHDPRGRARRLADAIPELLATVRAVAEPGGFILLTAHTPGFDPGRLAESLARTFGRRPSAVQAGELRIDAKSGARLGLGAFARIMDG